MSGPMRQHSRKVFRISYRIPRDLAADPEGHRLGAQMPIRDGPAGRGGSWTYGSAPGISVGYGDLPH